MTTAEHWNERAGRSVFAEQLDMYGLPLDGWAIPTLTIRDDQDNRRVRLYVGTYRRVGSKMQCASIYIDIGHRRIAAREDMADVPADALARLLSRMAEFEEESGEQISGHLDRNLLHLALRQ